MGRLRFGSCAGTIVAVSLLLLLLLLPACGKKKPAGSSPFPVRITLTPTTSFSMQVGSILQLTATAQNNTNANLVTAFTFASSDPSTLDIAPSGAACAGTWNAPIYSLCTPGGIGAVQVTASALGATSPPTLIFVHAPIDNITVTLVTPVNPPPPACPNQGPLPAACNFTFTPTNLCLSQNQVETLQANAFTRGGEDITASVGPFTWNEVSPSVVKTTPIISSIVIGSTAYTIATNQISAAPATPGQTQIVASASGVSSQPYNFETCVVQCIALQVGSTPGISSFAVNKGAAETITATAVDVQGCIVPKAPLTWISSEPAALAAAACMPGTTCNVTTPQPGTAAITASCTPPTCNVGFPLNPAGYSPPFVPEPVYPVTAVSGLVTGAPVAASIVASSQDCSSNPLCAVAIYTVKAPISVSGSATQLPFPPNSLLFDLPGDKVFTGGEFGAVAINPLNFGGTSSPFSFLSAPGTPLGLVTGKVLAVSPNGGVAIFSDTVSTPNQVYVVNTVSNSTTALNIDSAIAAAFSPDGENAYILGNGGTTLYADSPLQALQVLTPNPLPTPATSIVFSSTGTFALLAGGGAAGSLAAYNTCDNSAVTLKLPVVTPPPPPLPAPPLFMKMVPAGDIPQGNPMGNTFGGILIPNLEPAGLDFFFGLDNTGIDIIATNSSAPTTGLCPQQVNLAYAPPLPLTTPPPPPTPQDTFAPVHININHGTFQPINFFLSPDATQAFIVTSDFGVLIYHFNTTQVSTIELVNNANPVAADITPDGTLIYVAGSDGLMHELNVETGLDQNQASFPPLANSANGFCYTGTNCAFNLIAVKP